MFARRSFHSYEANFQNFKGFEGWVGCYMVKHLVVMVCECVGVLCKYSVFVGSFSNCVTVYALYNLVVK